MIYRSRTSKGISAWIADKRGAWSSSAGSPGAPASRRPIEGQVCPGFHLYRGFVGCPAWAAGQPCRYCYLRTTFRTDPELRGGVAWVDAPLSTLHSPRSVSNARAAVEKWLLDASPQTCSGMKLVPGRTMLDPCDHPTSCADCQARILNAGELADSLAFSPADNPHIAMLLDLFSDPATNPHGHKLLLLTKANEDGSFAHLAGRQPSEHVIVSWSIGNAIEMEPISEAIGYKGRLSAATIARSLGWRVRWRIDPLVAENAGQHAFLCAELTAQCRGKDGLADRFPELITLGTLRHRGGRVKLPPEERLGIYRSALEGLRDGGYEGPVGLCKETPDMIREVLEIDPADMPCNCLP